MGMGQKSEGGRLRKLRRPALSLCALLSLVFLLAFLGQTDPSPSQVSSVPQGDSVLMLEEWEDLCLFTYTGSQTGSGAALAVNRTSGRLMSSYGFSESDLVWAALRGDRLLALENRGNASYLTELSLPELNFVSSGLFLSLRTALRCSTATGRAVFITPRPAIPRFCAFLNPTATNRKWMAFPASPSWRSHPRGRCSWLAAPPAFGVPLPIPNLFPPPTAPWLRSACWETLTMSPASSGLFTAMVVPNPKRCAPFPLYPTPFSVPWTGKNTCFTLSRETAYSASPFPGNLWEQSPPGAL